MAEFYVVESEGTGEIVEKKSRFIAHVIPIDAEQQALEYIDFIKKKYWDARHNCFAFVIGKNNETQRFSDDGEPQGTAGKPILEVLLNQNIHNTLIIVTRYFGGTLLGTGGLVRAYGQASKKGLENAVIKRVCSGIKIQLTADYNSIGKIKYIIGEMKVTVLEEQYAENVIITVSMKEEIYQQFVTKVTDATNGKTLFDMEEKIEYRESI
jgi:uncharacterized YigZ family protein